MNLTHFSDRRKKQTRCSLKVQTGRRGRPDAFPRRRQGEGGDWMPLCGSGGWKTSLAVILILTFCLLPEYTLFDASSLNDADVQLFTFMI